MSGLETLFNVHTHHNFGAERAILQTVHDFQIIPTTYFSVGIHPEQAKDELEFPKTFMDGLEQDNCLAIGEIGLDSRYENPEQQEIYYIAQLELAQKFNKPILLHCVNRWDRCRFLHQKYASGVKIIYHGFNKPAILLSVLEYPD